ncbi:hypothetical protein P7H00_05420 [Enterococcus pseudoavium]|uniref:Uncharacterized protein n=1 Tax=Enterococcus pseudoavium TaxID=44007 RepID=A0AAE4I213_9ENTE|nr:hypothetical protein [Enterococcus pseudoavium]MDT2736575.1 hypothetical protein [Enterococcus pseudoavium]MDT2755010.1 hypothetical protein [Enterococcus pseudoavium]MDT2770909.1 hypothetical protein [Enterococcus pseudoavium]REC31760.1 hypothetical protein CF160_04550 [Enterococcus pseudoavium]
MNKRQRKKRVYKQYIRAIFEGYEQMLEDPSIKELQFSYLKETTYLERDAQDKIHFTTKEQ